MGLAAMWSVDVRNIELRRAWRRKFFSGFTGIDPFHPTERYLFDRHYARKRRQARQWLATHLK